MMYRALGVWLSVSRALRGGGLDRKVHDYSYLCIILLRLLTCCLAFREKCHEPERARAELNSVFVHVCVHK